LNDYARGRRAHAGDLVQVRSENEILGTLDASGRLEGLTFMPEMLAHCGTTMRVFRRADKTCVRFSGIRRIENAVLMEGARCDGSAHGGCEAGCLFFWKDEWLRPVRVGRPPTILAAPPTSEEPLAPASGPTREESDQTRQQPGESATFSCQATDLLTATKPLPGWDLRQYIRDVSSGNFGIVQAGPALAKGFAGKAQRASQGAMAGVFARAERRAMTNAELPREPQRIPVSPQDETALPGASNIQPGDLVRVRSQREIEATLDSRGENRGLAFQPEMELYHGREFRVLKRLERIIDESSGKMLRLRDCIVLDGIVCEASYHRLCPRSAFLYWREAWLVKVG
jgi:hypothetical protein